jgi:LacI family transcriptional regulator
VTRLADVAARAGVSTATISRVINSSGYVSEDLRERVLKAVAELNYSPNGVARSMSQRRTLTLGLVVPDISNPFFTAVARGAEDVGQKSGYSLVLCNTDRDLDKERGYLSVLREKRVDGVMLIIAGAEITHVQQVLDAGMNLVLVDRASPALKAPSVLADNQSGVYEATKYLLSLGHHRIAVVTGPAVVNNAVERLHGYEQALEEAGLPIDQALVIPGNFTYDGGRKAGYELLDLLHPPTAVISLNNGMTTGLLMALRERGTRIPVDISVIGFDDLPYFQLLEHPLTAVSQPMYEMGRRACELLLELIGGGIEDPALHHVRLPTRLILRDSCSRINSTAHESGAAIRRSATHSLSSYDPDAS